VLFFGLAALVVGASSPSASPLRPGRVAALLMLIGSLLAFRRRLIDAVKRRR
jgi:hypothetical protein